MRDAQGHKLEPGDQVHVYTVGYGEVVAEGADKGILVKIEIWCRPDDVRKVDNDRG